MLDKIIEAFSSLSVRSEAKAVPAVVVAELTENTRVVQATTTGDYCILNRDSIQTPDTGFFPSIQDDIKIISLGTLDTPRRGITLYVKEYSFIACDAEEELVGVVETEPGMIKVVGRSFPTPALVACPFDVARHDFVIGRVKCLKMGFQAVKKFDSVAVVDSQLEKNASPQSRGVCTLSRVRPLTDVERKVVENGCRKVNNLTLRQAELYIRDVNMAIIRMENYVKSVSIEKHTLEIPGDASFDRMTSRFTLTLTLDYEEAEVIRSQAMESWTLGTELIMKHPDICRENARIIIPQGLPMSICDIKRLHKTAWQVRLKPSICSSEMFAFLCRCGFEFDEDLDFIVGPSEDEQDVISEVYEAYFKRFYENKAFFDAFRCAGPPDKSKPQLYEVKLNGSYLDKSQENAMCTAISRKFFTTVEAPPGSGKTFLIAAMNRLKDYVSSTGMTLMSAQTNVAVTNAVEVTKKNCPKIRSTRQFGRRAEMQIGENQKHISLHHMALNAGSFVDLDAHAKLQEMKYSYELACRNFARARDLKLGMEYSKQKTATLLGLKSCFVDAFLPRLYGTTCSLVLRRTQKRDADVARQIKEGREPDYEDMDKCIMHLILDEASQLPSYLALAVYMMLPMLERVTVIGDSKQLSPFTQLDVDSFAWKLVSKGELQRLQEGKNTSTNRTFLSTIYRCHPRIMNLIYKPIYGEDLHSGTEADDRALAITANLPKAGDGSPLLFVQLEGKGQGCQNEGEAKVVLKFLEELKNKGITGEDVAIVCHHRRQRELLSRKLRGKGNVGPFKTSALVCTVDSFQGMEAKVVLVLMTKTANNPTGNIAEKFSFVSQPNRETVAITRSQHAVYLFGQWDLILQMPFWKKFIPSIVESKALVTVDWKQASNDMYNKIQKYAI